MKIDGSAVRTGMVIDFENKLWLVIKHEIRTPGNLRAFNQVEMKDVKTGTKKNTRFNSGESIERVSLDSKSMQYLYEEGENITMMDTTSYEQISLPKALLGDSVKFLTDNMMIAIDLYEGTPISARLPETVVAVVAETEPSVKGQTASSSYKPATLENGIRVMVPPFIAVGEAIVVNTVELTYLERAKKAS